MKTKKKNKDYNKEIKIACLKCKAKFNAWVATASFDFDVEERIRKRFYQYCVACREYETKNI